MTEGEEGQLDVADALEAWRDAERQVARSTAQREAADMARDAAILADQAAQATAAATDAARFAAAEASTAAQATADAAHKVMLATQAHGEARRVKEAEALAAEEDAKAVHRAAVSRVQERQARADSQP